MRSRRPFIVLAFMVSAWLPGAGCANETEFLCSETAPWDCVDFCCPDSHPVGCRRSAGNGCTDSEGACTVPPADPGTPVDCTREAR